MAEEICGGTWWNPARSSTLLSPCSGGINGMTDNHIGSFGWSSNSSSSTIDHHLHHNLHHMVDMKPSAAAATTTTTGNSTDLKQQHSTDSDSNTTGGSSSNNSSILMDSSTLQMINFGLSASSTSSSTDWNPAALALEDHMNTQIQKDWSPTNMAAASYGYPSTLLQSLFEPDEVSLQTPQQQQQCLLINNNNNYMSGSLSGGGNYGTNVVSNDIQLSPNNSWPPKNNIANPLLKPSLLHKHHQQTTSSTAATTTAGFHFSNNATFWNPSAASAPLNDVRTAFYHPSTAQSHQFLTPPSAAAIEEKPSCTTLTAKSNNEEVRESVSVAGKKGNSSEPAFKRPRIETPSPLPTFKVRKEKLGDRITALQQLVSPFGKTDTASVLHEAIDYIRLLHEQVNILSTPYMKQGTPYQQQQQVHFVVLSLKQYIILYICVCTCIHIHSILWRYKKCKHDMILVDTKIRLLLLDEFLFLLEVQINDLKLNYIVLLQSCDHKLKDPDQLKQDLKSRGLCLVPIASTFPVANETTVADLWTPTYGGGSYR
ncbi:hypothetical protein Ddye_019498 [Dipteronia dyeriana]|uniref:BHLH domain-containing protein n=1 Tax=Dipteronia dyeriana TaxID=168575 RepID=A0AAD9TYX5_9ROSI|nr:hypothetical protein Ddye_019498 [Dipteronia dyeriana]